MDTSCPSSRSQCKFHIHDLPWHSSWMGLLPPSLSTTLPTYLLSCFYWTSDSWSVNMYPRPYLLMCLLSVSSHYHARSWQQGLCLSRCCVSRVLDGAGPSSQYTLEEQQHSLYSSQTFRRIHLQGRSYCAITSLTLTVLGSTHSSAVWPEPHTCSECPTIFIWLSKVRLFTHVTKKVNGVLDSLALSENSDSGNRDKLHTPLVCFSSTNW